MHFSFVSNLLSCHLLYTFLDDLNHTACCVSSDAAGILLDLDHAPMDVSMHH